ncbi:CDP-alcohol phosphatidyltransferase family protein [Rothia sp. ZJ932]|uniref:CDP-alcohol phosphatidyltransferase family protein n=1 Tax=Rothia sp. ZJ932 TaxID=2810516 RepID=UPI0019679DD4|nr:CDP-alcohol phosphatidyltransferase family protein [Rothia sp. ZJ932]QRZ61173.1 CDP-alcohol phosphatidyltransferase family protein [Rothia sp. ZJ932]
MNSARSVRPRGFKDTLAALNSAQKPGIGVPAYTRWVNRHVARVFAAAAVKFGITPNGVTAISAGFSALGLLVLLFAAPTVVTGFLVALLFALGYALDSADGQVARVTGASSPAGEWLDHVVDSVRVPSVHLAVLVGFVRYSEHWAFTGWQLWWLPMAFTVVTVGHFMSQILAEQLRNNRKTAAPPTGGPLRSFVNLHMDAGTLCWIFVFWGFGLGFIVVYGVLFAGNLLTVLVSMRRKYISLSSSGA